MNLENCKKEFLKYTENYDLENPNIKRKQLHSLRVMEIAKNIAIENKFSEEEIEVSALIGLLHDIARFEQFTKYRTFKDLRSIDHGDLGADILKTEIRKYIDINIYDDEIIKAVKNHNKFQIEKGLTPKEEIYAKLIRDADKIDIMYEAVEMFWKGEESEVEKCQIRSEIFEEIKNHKNIKSRIDENALESTLKVLTFVFDINFISSLKIIKKEKYVDKIIDRYHFENNDVKKQIEEIREIINNYIDEKIMKG